MQILLPLFPSQTVLINNYLGVFAKDDIVYYLHSGMPIYTHDTEDLKSFRFITSQLIDAGRCRASQVSRTFGIRENIIYHYLKIYREHGAEGIFAEEKRGGKSHKLIGARLQRVQKKLDAGKSNNAIAKEEKISEGTIRYNLKVGHLKKNLLPA
jgi:transposase